MKNDGDLVSQKLQNVESKTMLHNYRTFSKFIISKKLQTQNFSKVQIKIHFKI